MNDTLLKVYQILPHPAQSLAATLRGLYLRSWRYGPETERLVAEAIERESWDAATWTTWREQQLARLLERASSRVPYYQRLWEERQGRCGAAARGQLANWPVLEKEKLRGAPLDFVAEDCQPARMFYDHTSGSTGQPIQVWLSRETVRAWYALFEARCRRWYGVSRHDRWAILGGQLVTPASRRRPPFWVWNRAMNQLYLSSNHLAPDLIPHYLDALRRYRIRYLFGYSSSLYTIAFEILHRGLEGPKMAVVITNAEPILEYQRRVISEAFQCPVRETYGMTEVVAAASECEAGSLHLWPEVGHVEILDGDRPVSVGQTGDIVATGFLNMDTPLIRYRVGDRGALLASDTHCSCGRKLPLLRSIDGRRDDVLYTTDGRQISILDPFIKVESAIREGQIIQEALNRVRVRYVPTSEFTSAAAALIIAQIQERMGPVEVVLEAVESIPRGPNGKLRMVICELPPDQRSIAQRSMPSG